MHINDMIATSLSLTTMKVPTDVFTKFETIVRLGWNRMNSRAQYHFTAFEFGRRESNDKEDSPPPLDYVLLHVRKRIWEKT